MKRLIVMLSLFWFCNSCIAQSPVMDSLKKVLRLAKHDTTKCNTLIVMVESEVDDAIWPAYNDQLFSIADKGIKVSNDSALRKFYRVKLALYYINKGYFNQYVKENSAEAIRNYYSAIGILESVNHLVGLASAYNNLGSAYENIGDIKKAIEYYNLSLDCKEKTGDKKAGALPLNNIGMIFHRQADYKNAIKYYLRSINISKNIEDAHGIAYASNNIGLTYQKMKNYKMAEAYFKSAIYNWESSGNNRLLSYAYNNLGSLYLEMGQPKPAKEMLNKSYEIATNLGDAHVQAYTNLNYAKIALAERDIKTAESKGLKALELSKKLAYPENIRDVAMVLSEIYSAAKKHKASLEMYELFIRMRDSLNNEQNKRASIKSDLKYDFERKAIADSVRVMEEKKLSMEEIKQEKTQRSVLYYGLALLFVFALFMLNRYRVINAQKEIISSQTKTVELQKQIVEEKQKEIMDSIHYAKRIQLSHLPSEKYFSNTLKRLKTKNI